MSAKTTCWSGQPSGHVISPDIQTQREKPGALATVQKAWGSAHAPGSTPKSSEHISARVVPPASWVGGSVEGEHMDSGDSVSGGTSREAAEGTASIAVQAPP